MISRLKKLADDSNNVMPNGVIWNDDIWDTYDDHIYKKKTNINREWTFEQPINNSEWNLQQNN